MGEEDRTAMLLLLLYTGRQQLSSRLPFVFCAITVISLCYLKAIVLIVLLSRHIFRWPLSTKDS